MVKLPLIQQHRCKDCRRVNRWGLLGGEAGYGGGGDNGEEAAIVSNASVGFDVSQLECELVVAVDLTLARPLLLVESSTIVAVFVITVV